MKNKIIALVLVIPLLFMFTIFSFTNQASINIAVSASSIVINNKPTGGNVYLSIGETFVVDASVYPVKATDTNYSVVVLVTEGEDDAIVADGNTIKANNIGKANVTVSTANGFTDSFSVISTSDKAFAFDSYVVNSEGQRMDWNADFATGSYTISNVVKPITAQADYTYATSDSSIATVTVGGVLTLLSTGIVTITVTLADGALGTIENSYTIKVAFPENQTGVVVGGQADSNVINVATADNMPTYTTVIELADYWQGDISLVVDGVVLSADCYSLTPLTATMSTASSTTKYNLTINLAKIAEEVDSDGEFAIGIFVADFDTEYSLAVKVVGHSFSMTTTMNVDGSSYLLGNAHLLDETADKDNGEKATLHVETENLHNSSDYSYEWTIEGDALSIVGDNDATSCVVVNNGNSISTARIRLIVMYKGAKVFNKYITVSPIKVTSMAFSNLALANSNGISSTRAVVNGFTLPLEVNGVSADKVNWQVLGDKLSINTSSRVVATASSSSDNAVLNVNSTGYVTITISYGGVSSAVELYAVHNGVEVSSSKEFFEAMDSNKAVVLTDNVQLGDHMTLAERTAHLKSHTFVSTYNTTYLDNKNMSKTLSYIVDITNNIHGNGHTVSAELFSAMPTESQAYAGQKGPVDYISVSFAGAEIRVYGQDNVAFLMRTDDVVVDNVNLSGRDSDSLLTADGYIDLTRLDYAGTVVDINANVAITNSRIYNGRNVVRVYGGNVNGDNFYESIDSTKTDYAYGMPLKKNANGSIAEQITVDISSCRLFNGREFVLKIGSNKAVQAVATKYKYGVDSGGNDLTQVVQPKLYNHSTNKPLEPGATYSDSDQQYFNDNYVNTIVNLADSLLYDAGLMVVGMESAFCGPAIISEELSAMFEGIFVKLGAEMDFELGWYNIAATSYASVLNVLGSTNIYAWKDVDSVDTSSIINIVKSGNAEIDKQLDLLDFDIGEMLGTIDGYDDMRIEVNESSYMYCGICMYGGGYNYSQVNFPNDSMLSNTQLFRVNLNGVDSSLNSYMPIVAGEADFRFYMHSNSSSFNMEQEQIARSGDKITACRIG